MDVDQSRPPIDRRLDEARRQYVDANPGSGAWSDRARRVMPGGNTRSVLHVDPFPLRIEHAEASRLRDVDGHEYLDLLGNYTAGLLGHSPGPVLEAARSALDHGWSYGSTHENEVRLAELLVDRFPSIEQIRFTNSGTEANLMALAVATHHTGRDEIVVFRSGYHGGVLTFGSDDNPVNVRHDWTLCDYNDVDGVSRAFERSGEGIAAVLVEPMQGSGGCLPGDPEFLRALRTLCDDAGAVLIFDEVMTSRFSIGGAQRLLDITPDMTTLGKYLAGGFTFGAFGGRADIMAHFDPRTGGALGHAGTFNNNVTSMAAGVAALEEVLTPEVLAETHDRGDRLRTGLNEIFADADVAMCATGVGSLMNVHATRGPVRSVADLADADERLRELFYFHCLEAGVFLARRGFIALSIEITDGDVERFLDVARRFATSLT